ncbi:hypothetical protein QTJ16_003285 [Diplocarpon rosae]|uniref:DlpA domain-containing protein n=1 Tax=Diplocarpon rosae TaxID=946125 RepID=A0AAD9WFR0_9HELO|nr:hypothetical protein QTJ16_003285 [Diplocarpon rosae]
MNRYIGVSGHSIINQLRTFSHLKMATYKPTSHDIEFLRNYTACDIADALLKLKVPNAGFLADLKPFTSRPRSLRTVEKGNPDITMAPASTVLFAPKTGDTSNYPAGNIPTDNHYVDLTVPETIVVMQQPAGQKCAVLGGIMALRMKALNAKAIVVNGRVRDVEELASTELLVWAKATSIVGAGAEAKPHAIQVPLDIDGTLVKPGDLVFSDYINGIVIIPHDKVSEVISLLPDLVQADNLVKDDVQKGSTVQESFKNRRG